MTKIVALMTTKKTEFNCLCDDDDDDKDDVPQFKYR